MLNGARAKLNVTGFRDSVSSGIARLVLTQQKKKKKKEARQTKDNFKRKRLCLFNQFVAKILCISDDFFITHDDAIASSFSFFFFFFFFFGGGGGGGGGGGFARNEGKVHLYKVYKHSYKPPAMI